ncbi:hypothetical protein [Dialister invisus]|nr:hypothetical protein [Dialister invisus]
MFESRREPGSAEGKIRFGAVSSESSMMGNGGGHNEEDYGLLGQYSV